MRMDDNFGLREQVLQALSLSFAGHHMTTAPPEHSSSGLDLPWTLLMIHNIMT
ncbi:MAG: hypothetical protein R3191_01555 [Anaerolineales bacterium]|nr:hypothetical protein [Anaerolineales bacterium]